MNAEPASRFGQAHFLPPPTALRYAAGRPEAADAQGMNALPATYLE
jgi:hypothetical protein